MDKDGSGRHGEFYPIPTSEMGAYRFPTYISAMVAPTPFWSQSEPDLLQALASRPEGLTQTEADARRPAASARRMKANSQLKGLRLLLNQYRSPISLLLIASAVLAFFLSDSIDAIMILVIVLASGLLGFWQEHTAGNAVAKLLALVRVEVSVFRDGKVVQLPADQIVPGDRIQVNAGDTLPGDCRLLTAKDLMADESSLTGESFPVQKEAGVVATDAPVNARSNVLFMGTHIVSGQGEAVLARLGMDTQLGAISGRLDVAPPETDFEAGIRRFGFLLMEVTLLLVLVIFAVNVSLHKPLLSSLLFSLAIAVGLTPQLLPAILAINLAKGAQAMAKVQVIVKRLASIESLGSMTVLCTDKTGTLTEGQIVVNGASDPVGQPSTLTLERAYLNADLQSGFNNPMDVAICAALPTQPKGQKLDEVAYDFIRKRLSVLVQLDEGPVMITKGAVMEVMALCTQAQMGDAVVALPAVAAQAQVYVEGQARQGTRVIAVAQKSMPGATQASKTDEAGMTLLGFLTFADPPKKDVVEVIAALHKSGVALKVITGDNVLVAEAVARQIGMAAPRVMSGKEMASLSRKALAHRALRTDVFAEIEPNGKEQILLALKRAGQVVGYMGDGINDASALYAADVGISVNDAVPVAKEAADIVLLNQDLAVVLRGVVEGRRTFANTLKYIFMATSANFGNMFSMAGASLLLPFLPLLPGQILLTNLLTDLPQLTLSTDSADATFTDKPHRWNLGFIQRFMVVFGLISSLFDFATFGLFYVLLKASPDAFRTGWFTESVISACLIVLVVRTRLSIFRSKPSLWLVGASAAVVALVVALPSTFLGPLLGFAPLPAVQYGYIAGIVGAYLVVAEGAKHVFYRVVKY